MSAPGSVPTREGSSDDEVNNPPQQLQGNYRYVSNLMATPSVAPASVSAGIGHAPSTSSIPNYYQARGYGSSFLFGQASNSSGSVSQASQGNLYNASMPNYYEQQRLANQHPAGLSFTENVLHNPLLWSQSMSGSPISTPIPVSNHSQSGEQMSPPMVPPSSPSGAMPLASRKELEFDGVSHVSQEDVARNTMSTPASSTAQLMPASASAANNLSQNDSSQHATERIPLDLALVNSQDPALLPRKMQHIVDQLLQAAMSDEHKGSYALIGIHNAEDLLFPPAAAEDIEKFSNEHLGLPDDLKEFLKITNGFRGCSCFLNGGVAPIGKVDDPACHPIYVSDPDSLGEDRVARARGIIGVNWNAEYDIDDPQVFYDPDLRCYVINDPYYQDCYQQEIYLLNLKMMKSWPTEITDYGDWVIAKHDPHGDCDDVYKSFTDWLLQEL